MKSLAAILFIILGSVTQAQTANPAPAPRPQVRCDLTIVKDGDVQNAFNAPLKVFYEDPRFTELFIKEGSVSANYGETAIHQNLDKLSLAIDNVRISAAPKFDTNGRAELTYVKDVGTPKYQMILLKCRKLATMVATDPISDVPSRTTPPPAPTTP